MTNATGTKLTADDLANMATLIEACRFARESLTRIATNQALGTPELDALATLSAMRSLLPDVIEPSSSNG